MGQIVSSMKAGSRIIVVDAVLPLRGVFSKLHREKFNHFGSANDGLLERQPENERSLDSFAQRGR